METSDLALSTPSDISILHKIIKLASVQKLTFSSIQLALKSLSKSQQITQLDKYLNFFMLIKSNMKDDSSIVWNQMFHVYVRKLEREVMGDVVYRKRLVGKCFVKWRELLSMKIIDEYVVEQGEMKETEEIVDPEIKVKAKVFHCWMVYVSKKIEKRDRKQEEENQINQIGRVFEINKISRSLKRWKQHFDEIKKTRQSTGQIVQYLQNNKKSNTLLLLKQNRQRKDIVNILQQKIKCCIIKVQKHSLFNYLRSNINKIQKPKKINSYYGMMFLKHLIQKVYNNRKSIEYSNLHSIIKFKSKVRKDVFKEQMDVFYDILKQKAFKGWKTIIIERQNKSIKIIELIKRNIVRSLGINSKKSQIIKNKLKIIKRLVLKKNFKNLILKTQTISNSIANFEQIQIEAKERISYIRRSINFPIFKQNLAQLKNQNSNKSKLCQFLFNSKIRYTFKQFHKSANTNKVSNNIPLITQNKLLRKYFKSWIKFYQQRDMNMVGIYRFQINHTKKVKSCYFNKLKDMMSQRNKENTNISYVKNVLKNNVLSHLLDNNRKANDAKPINDKFQLVKKQIYFSRFISRTQSQLSKQKQQQNQYTKVIQTQTKLKAFNILKNAIQQKQENIRNTIKFIEQQSTKRALSCLFKEMKYSQSVTRLRQLRLTNLTRQVFANLRFVFNGNQCDDERESILQALLFKNKIRSVITKLKSNQEQSLDRRNRISECSNIKKQTYFRLINKLSIEAFNSKKQLSEKQSNLCQVYSKTMLKSFNHNAKKYVQNSKQLVQIESNSEQLQSRLIVTRLSTTFDLLKIQIKYRYLKQKIQIKNIEQWRHFFQQIKRQTRLSQQNQLKMQKFKLKRNKKILKTTLKSFIIQINRRQQSLNTISSIFKSKQQYILKYSMNSIFDEYRVGFKLHACQQIRKRFALQRIINNYLQKETVKLQEYKSVKHYAEALANKVFKGFSLAVCREQFGDENVSNVLKTVPNNDYYRRYSKLY